MKIIEVKATDGPGWIEWWWPTKGDEDVEAAFNKTSNHPNNRGFQFRIRDAR
jgi:hypothetical protein